MSMFLVYMPTNEPEGTRLNVRFRLRLINLADRCISIYKEKLSATFGPGQAVFGCKAMLKLASECGRK